MKKALLLFLVVTLAVSCSTIYPSLIIVEDGTLETEHKKGIKKFDDGISVAVEGLDVDREDITGVFISIENNSGERYSFNESDITIFGGDSTTGEWTEIGEWNSGEYLLYAEERRVKEQSWLITTLNLLAGSDVDRESRTSDKTLTRERSYIEKNSAQDVISSTFITDPVWLTDVMLYSKEIGDGSTYSGLVLFSGRNENKKTYLDIKIVYTHGDESREFILSRSDRKDILNPWLDSTYSKITAAALYGVTTKSYGAMLMYTNPKWIQPYYGATFSENHSDFQLGVTRKLFPYTWLLGGFNLILKSRYGSDLAPQLGAAVVVNNITLFALGEYGLNKQTAGVRIGAGYAFVTR